MKPNKAPLIFVSFSSSGVAMSIPHSISAANALLGGSKSTQSTRRLISLQLVAWLETQGVYLEKIQAATSDQVQDYLFHRQKGDSERDIKPLRMGSLKNLQSAINKVVNVHRPATHPRREAIRGVKLGQRSRRGTKRPPTDQEYAEAIQKAIETSEQGFVLMLKLERLLGLRAQEALCCIPALKRHLAMHPVQDSASIYVGIADGTKGGRARSVEIIANRKDETWEVINQAVCYAKENKGHLLNGKKPGLKSARSRYQYLCRKVGLVGEISGHALRYAYAVEKLTELKELGMTRREASQWVARSLGHGASRDRYVRLVYGQPC
jgi:integrase